MSYCLNNQQKSTACPIPSTTKHEIEFALTLNFSIRPRLSCLGNREIVIDKTLKQPNETHRSMVLFLAYRWGWQKKMMP